MSLYLRLGVGDGLYLLDSARIAEIRPYAGGDLAWNGNAVPIVDLRRLFAAPANGAGCAILTILPAPASGDVAALIADRADNLVEIADTDWCAIPPIGPMGGLIDAVCLLSDGEKPMLRLRSENALASSRLASG